MKKVIVAADKRRRFYGFVENYTPPAESSYSRFGMVLDCADSRLFDDNPDNAREAEALALTRISSTPSRLASLFQLPRVPGEGDWVELELDDVGDRPRAWVVEASNDYAGPAVPTRVVGMRFLTDEIETRVGEPTRVRSAFLHNVMQFCSLGPTSYFDAGEFRAIVELALLSQSYPRIRIADVGQASCAALHIEANPLSPILGYFDVGAPLFFHDASFRQPFHEAVPNDGFVFLSHWDFDHYALALRFLPELRGLRWYAPQQTVGFNAARFQRLLGPKLQFIGDVQLGMYDGPQLLRGTGPADDRNNSGYVLQIPYKDGNRLLTGDVAYNYIPSIAFIDVAGLAVTHHGGMKGVAPPTGAGLAIASYGVPNRYHHPYEAFLQDHAAAGWTIQRTATHGRVPRGDRWL